MSDQDAPSLSDSALREPLKPSGLAIASLICAFLVPPLGLVLAVLALRSIKSNPATGGKGIAVAGAVVSGMFSLMLVGLTVLIAAVAIPNIAKARKDAQVTACKTNLRTIEMAIQQWAIEKRKAGDAEVTPEDIESYMKDGIPRCPSGGEYELRTVGEKPTCTIEGHSIEYSY